MTTIFTEKTRTGELAFEFSDKWQVCKYDELPFYDEIRYQGFKGIDFMALSAKGLLLMEVKYVLATNETSPIRFTVDADKNKVKEIKDSLTPEQNETVIIKSARPYIVDEVTQKVRDTVLGLFASYRKEKIELSSYSQSLFTSNNQPILVLLFLERNPELNQEESFKPLASNLKLAIEQKLNILGNIQVGVVNTLTLPSTLEIKILENTPTS
jgi:hypothetical protein